MDWELDFKEYFAILSEIPVRRNEHVQYEGHYKWHREHRYITSQEVERENYLIVIVHRVMSKNCEAELLKEFFLKAL